MEQIARSCSRYHANEIFVGDVQSMLGRLHAGSIHTVVTSPPYWGLRDYKTEPLLWEDGWRGHLGQEPHPEEYVGHLVDVFRKVRRVLRDDGTLWLNLGDCFATGAGRAGQSPGGGAQGKRWKGLATQPNRLPQPGLKPKDLVGIPWRVALALQADGWYLRMDNIWDKRNCMPSSAQDRPTSSHEYVFLLSKKERYFYDQEAVREVLESDRQSSGNLRRFQPDAAKQPREGGSQVGRSIPWHNDGRGRNMRSVWRLPSDQFYGELCTACKAYYEELPTDALCRCGEKDSWLSHYATFPEEIPARAILAGTSEKGVCAQCLAPHVRVVERDDLDRPIDSSPREVDGGKSRVHGWDRSGMTHREVEMWLREHPPRTVGWKKTCSCKEDLVLPAVVLDPFMGSGTTAMTALKLARRFVGVELNPDYAALARGRLSRELSQPRLL